MCDEYAGGKYMSNVVEKRVYFAELMGLSIVASRGVGGSLSQWRADNTVNSAAQLGVVVVVVVSLLLGGQPMHFVGGSCSLDSR
jgi:hypothetical protein